MSANDNGKNDPHGLNPYAGAGGQQSGENEPVRSKTIISVKANPSKELFHNINSVKTNHFFQADTGHAN